MEVRAGTAASFRLAYRRMSSRTGPGENPSLARRQRGTFGRDYGAFGVGTAGGLMTVYDGNGVKEWVQFAISSRDLFRL